jgi:predicted Zn-ribbon and HTH transcriptional regulator
MRLWISTVIARDSLTKHMTTDIITKTFECDNCGYVWHPTLWLLPKTCPKCRSPDWDTLRKK